MENSDSESEAVQDPKNIFMCSSDRKEIDLTFEQKYSEAKAAVLALSSSEAEDSGSELEEGERVRKNDVFCKSEFEESFPGDKTIEQISSEYEMEYVRWGSESEEKKTEMEYALSGPSGLKDPLSLEFEERRLVENADEPMSVKEFKCSGSESDTELAEDMLLQLKKTVMELQAAREQEASIAKTDPIHHSLEVEGGRADPILKGASNSKTDPIQHSLEVEGGRPDSKQKKLKAKKSVQQLQTCKKRNTKRKASVLSSPLKDMKDSSHANKQARKQGSLNAKADSRNHSLKVVRGRPDSKSKKLKVKSSVVQLQTKKRNTKSKTAVLSSPLLDVKDSSSNAKKDILIKLNRSKLKAGDSLNSFTESAESKMENKCSDSELESLKKLKRTVIELQACSMKYSKVKRIKKDRVGKQNEKKTVRKVVGSDSCKKNSNTLKRPVANKLANKKVTITKSRFKVLDASRQIKKAYIKKRKIASEVNKKVVRQKGRKRKEIKTGNRGVQNTQEEIVHVRRGSVPRPTFQPLTPPPSVGHEDVEIVVIVEDKVEEVLVPDKSRSEKKMPDNVDLTKLKRSLMNVQDQFMALETGTATDGSIVFLRLFAAAILKDFYRLNEQLRDIDVIDELIKNFDINMTRDEIIKTFVYCQIIQDKDLNSKNVKGALTKHLSSDSRSLEKTKTQQSETKGATKVAKKSVSNRQSNNSLQIQQAPQPGTSTETRAINAASTSQTASRCTPYVTGNTAEEFNASLTSNTVDRIQGLDETPEAPQPQNKKRQQFWKACLKSTKKMKTRFSEQVDLSATTFDIPSESQRKCNLSVIRNVSNLSVTENPSLPSAEADVSNTNTTIATVPTSDHSCLTTGPNVSKDVSGFVPLNSNSTSIPSHETQEVTTGGSCTVPISVTSVPNSSAMSTYNWNNQRTYKPRTYARKNAKKPPIAACDHQKAPRKRGGGLNPNQSAPTDQTLNRMVNGVDTASNKYVSRTVTEIDLTEDCEETTLNEGISSAGQSSICPGERIIKENLTITVPEVTTKRNLPLSGSNRKINTLPATVSSSSDWTVTIMPISRQLRSESDIQPASSVSTFNKGPESVPSVPSDDQTLAAPISTNRKQVRKPVNTRQTDTQPSSTLSNAPVGALSTETSFHPSQSDVQPQSCSLDSNTADATTSAVLNSGGFNSRKELTTGISAVASQNNNQCFDIHSQTYSLITKKTSAASWPASTLMAEFYKEISFRPRQAANLGIGIDGQSALPDHQIYGQPATIAHSNLKNGPKGRTSVGHHPTRTAVAQPSTSSHTAPSVPTACELSGANACNERQSAVTSGVPNDVQSALPDHQNYGQPATKTHSTFAKGSKAAHDQTKTAPTAFSATADGTLSGDNACSGRLNAALKGGANDRQSSLPDHQPSSQPATMAYSTPRNGPKARTHAAHNPTRTAHHPFQTQPSTSSHTAASVTTASQFSDNEACSGRKTSVILGVADGRQTAMPDHQTYGQPATMAHLTPKNGLEARTHTVHHPARTAHHPFQTQPSTSSHTAPSVTTAHQFSEGDACGGRENAIIAGAAMNRQSELPDHQPYGQPHSTFGKGPKARTHATQHPTRTAQPPFQTVPQPPMSSPTTFSVIAQSEFADANACNGRQNAAMSSVGNDRQSSLPDHQPNNQPATMAYSYPRNGPIGRMHAANHPTRTAHHSFQTVAQPPTPSLTAPGVTTASQFSEGNACSGRPNAIVSGIANVRQSAWPGRQIYGPPTTTTSSTVRYEPEVNRRVAHQTANFYPQTQTVVQPPSNSTAPNITAEMRVSFDISRTDTPSERQQTDVVGVGRHVQVPHPSRQIYGPPTPTTSTLRNVPEGTIVSYQTSNSAQQPSSFSATNTRAVGASDPFSGAVAYSGEQNANVPSAVYQQQVALPSFQTFEQPARMIRTVIRNAIEAGIAAAFHSADTALYPPETSGQPSLPTYNAVAPNNLPPASSAKLSTGTQLVSPMTTIQNFDLSMLESWNPAYKTHQRLRTNGTQPALQIRTVDESNSHLIDSRQADHQNYH